MRGIVTVLVVFGAAALLSACGGGGGKKTPTSGMTASGLATAPATGKLPRTRIHQIDSVLAALETRDIDGVISYLHMTSMPCRATPAPGSTDVRCSPGVSEGAPTDAFPTAGCEGGYVRADEARSAVRAMLTERIDTAVLYGVYPVTTTDRLGKSWLALAKPTHVIILANGLRDYANTWSLLIGAEGIVGALSECGTTPESFVELWRLRGAVLPPPIPTPDTTRRSGIAEVDAIIDAVLSGKAEQQRSLTAFQEIACVGPTPGIGGPPRCEDFHVPDGTVVRVLPVADCAGYYAGATDFGILVNRPLGIYSAFRNGDGYEIVFSHTNQHGDRLGLAVTARNSRITALNYGCGQSPSELQSAVQPQDFVVQPLW